MKKLIILAICLTFLSGCSFILNGSMDYSTPHASEPNKDAHPMFVEVTSYQELCQALVSFVANHEDAGIVRFSAYNGDMENDLTKACSFVTNDSALGSYSVSYIGSSLNRIVSYYEATVNIIYKRDASEIAGIITADNADKIQDVIRNKLNTCKQKAAISIGDESINQDTFAKALDRAYYSEPDLIVAMPEMEITQYSDANGKGRIYEVTMTYPEPSDVMLSKRDSLETAIEQISLRLTGIEDSASRLYQLCLYLAENVTLHDDVSDEEYSRSDSINTAYGALYDRAASSEGYAMTMKLLCDWFKFDWADFECIVVSGRYNNYIHYWNMMKIDGKWYHFDITRLNDDPYDALMSDDDSMESAYSWDTSAYPACNGELDYTFLTESGNSVEDDEQE